VSGSFTSVRVGGGLLPSDVLSAVVAGSLDGLTSSDYHLGGESPRAAAARVWTHLLGVYRRFRDDLGRFPDDDPAVGVTRERWLTLLFSELGYGRLPATGPGGITVEDRAYPVSHLWGSTPIHLLGWGVPLDKRTPGVAGAAHRAPHAMVQELLNRDDAYLWAIVSNGRLLRLLRDSTTLAGQAYVEFDLEAMFDGELFSEFVLLYLLAHQSRAEIPAGGIPADCWLERWRITAVSQGVRALTLLRDGVQDALETLGTGFLQHPANSRLRDDLATGAIRLEDLHASLLREVYRLLFWAVAEDRDALLDPDTVIDLRNRYQEHFSSARLRNLAVRRHGSAHDDLWQSVSLVVTALGREDGEPRLGLPGLGGLFMTTEADVLVGARLANQTLLSAIRSLSIVQPKGQPRRLVDFRNLGAEELGSIYESLLELVPRHDPSRQIFTLENLAGNDRKTTGSYYTPTDLVDLVLDAALDPVLDDADKSPDPEQALLALTVCDPAIGSGHFMVAAARRIASRLATVRSGEIDPTPADTQQAMHDVVARCIYGVDLNPMAADLAKVSLWLEAMTPGKPLSFLDHHIKVGNSLLGATPALLHAGIPDSAYVAVTGDDKKTAAAWKKLNATERGGQADLFFEAGIPVTNANERNAAKQIADRATTAQTLADTAWAAQRYEASRATEAAVRSRRVADAWCAAFLGTKTVDFESITQGTLRAIGIGGASGKTESLVDEVAAQYRLFHWHLEFPEIFPIPAEGLANSPSGWQGGFSAILGNPPWDQVQLHPNEFFASRDSSIAEAATMAKRDKMIQALASTNPELHSEYLTAKRGSDSLKHFIHSSGAFPLTSFGRLNTYSLFAELSSILLAPNGRLGIITPTGLMTDSFNRHFAASILSQERLAAFYDFENEAGIFESVHNQFRFAVTSITGGKRERVVRFAFYTRFPSDIALRRYTLKPSEIQTLNPNSGTLPLFRSRTDAEITLKAYRRHPILVRENSKTGEPENPWGLRFSLMFMMNTSSHLFSTDHELLHEGASFDGWSWRRGSIQWLPLYEAKMVSHWNHRYATYEGATQAQLNKGTLPRMSTGQLDNPQAESRALFWIRSEDTENAIHESWKRDWFLGWRSVARASDMRTFVPSVVPRTAISGKFPIAMLRRPADGPLLQAIWSSFVFDYMARQKQSGADVPYHIVKQLPCPTPESFSASPAWNDATLGDFVRPRVFELTYTSFRVKGFAEDFCETPGNPFRWDPERREVIRAELDAAILHLYALTREDAEHVLESFFVVKKYEQRDFGEYRTKRLILAAYDAMASAAEHGSPFRSCLNPPPGEGLRHAQVTG
jgi:N-6 DNA Methylase